LDWSRRHFLKALAALGLTAGGCRSAREAEATAGPTETPTGPTTWPGKVALTRHTRAFAGDRISPQAVAELLDHSLTALTELDTPQQAWSRLFQPNDVVAIKVNCLAGLPLASHPEVVDAIVAGLRSAGVPEGNIIIFDRISRELIKCGFQIKGPGEGVQCYGTDVVGYDDEPTVVMSVGSCFSRVISEQATAIINVPVLKDHDLAGLTGALKNHYGSIHNPNKLHLEHCWPYIADLNCAPQIRNKHRLVVFDALYACYEGGPGYKPETTVQYGALMAATDPVAADAVALDLLEQLRAAYKLPPIMSEERAPKWIATAADKQHGLGVADLKAIELVRHELPA